MPLDARALALITSGPLTNDNELTLVLEAIAAGQTAIADALKRIQTQKPPGPSNTPTQLAAFQTIATESQTATTIATAYSAPPPIVTTGS